MSESNSGFLRSAAPWRTAAVAALCVFAAGCRSWLGSCHDPAAYQSAQTGAPLKIPPGLQSPDTTQALKIPQLNEPAPPPRSAKDSCLDAPPPFSTPKPPPEPAA